MRSLVLLTLAFVCSLMARGASAQVDAAREGLTTSGLCGLTFSSFPTCPTRVGLAANAGYGYTEEVGPVPGAHHRLAGSLGVGVVPLRYLAIALRFDGRVDFHPPDEFGSDHTGVGEPRLFVRGGHDLGRLSLGGELVVWVPGIDAPSLEPTATTVDLKALAAYRAHRPVAVLGHVGMRLDQSERTAPDDLSRVRAGDRALARDEAHRSSNALRLKLNKRTRIRSRLDEVPGIGPKTRARLLKAFGSVRAIEEADEVALKSAGATQAQAIAILRSFHGPLLPGEATRASEPPMAERAEEITPSDETTAEEAAVDNAFEHRTDSEPPLGLEG